MTDLLDINVWLALIDKRHVHHIAAAHYWEQDAAQELAFCRVTMMSFLRLSTNKLALSNPLSPQEAWTVYRQFLSLPIVRCLSEPLAIEEHFYALTADPAFPPRLWTDAYLAAFCVAAECRLVSFDGDFQRFKRLDFFHIPH